MTETIQPYPGMGATLLYPSDRYPAVITAVNQTGTEIEIEPLRDVGTDTGHAPDHFNGDYPVWDHTYTAAEITDLRIKNNRAKYTARLRKDGKFYTKGGTPILVGTARYYRDYSD